MVSAAYLDGRSTRMQTVALTLQGPDLVITGEDINIRIPFAQVRVDERLGRAARQLRLPNGCACEVRDLDGLDALLSAAAYRGGWVDRMQRHRPFILFAVIACIVIAVAAYKWVLPWTAAEVAQRVPPFMGDFLGDQTLKILDGGVFQPSKIPPDRQQRLIWAFRSLRLPEGGTSLSALQFRSSAQLPANAFTFPDGTIVVLDDLITSIDDDPQILAVLAHELGHVHGKHSLQLILRSSAVGAFLTFYFGDISTLLAIAPAAILQAKYSQDLEQEADDYGARLLRDNAMSPALLASALEKLAKLHPDPAFGGYLSSHPATDERMRHLRQIETQAD